MEQIALFRVTLKKSDCTNCGVCTAGTPCAAVPEILKDAKLRPDCFACNVCVGACKSCRAFSFGTRRTK